MKQHITEKQWLELNDKQKEKFIRGLDLNQDRGDIPYWNDKHGEWWNFPRIGTMIEFLGDALYFIKLNEKNWTISLFTSTKSKTWYPKLTDSLWEAVKEKLK